MALTAPWSKPDVVGRLLRAARTLEDRRLVVGYFGARSGLPLGPTPDAERGIALRDLPGPLHVDPESGGLATYYEIVLERVYVPGEQWIPGPGDTVVDVGANIGVFSLWAAGRIGPTGTLTTIEPNPQTFGLLERNAAGATIHRVACGETAGDVDFHYVPGKLSVGSILERPDRTETITVPVRPLDDLLAGHPPIDLLKIDVEGFEREVLAGAAKTLARTTRVALEIAGEDLGPSRALLEEAGFTMTGKVSGMWDLPERIGIIAHFER